MSSKKRRNQEKRQLAAETRTANSNLGFWKIIGAIALVITLGIGGLMAYNNHQDRAALLTPSETINGRDTNHDDSHLWASLRGQLVDFQADPFLGKKATTLYEQIPRYEAIVNGAFEKAAGLEIDYIADAHLEATAPDDPAIAQSQKKTRELLDSLRQDSTGLEGSYCDVMTTQCFIDELIMRTHEADPSISVERIKSIAYNDLMKTDATLGFMHDHPDAPITGLEVDALHLLHHATIETMERYGFSFKYAPLQETLSETRSDMALARMIVFMRKNNRQHGVIVLGYGHYARVKETMSRIGILSKVYNVQ